MRNRQTNRARTYRRSGLGSVPPCTPAPAALWVSEHGLSLRAERSTLRLKKALRSRFESGRPWLRKGRWANWHLKVFVPLPFTDSPSPDLTCDGGCR